MPGIQAQTRSLVTSFGSTLGRAGTISIVLMTCPRSHGGVAADICLDSFSFLSEKRLVRPPED